MLKYREKHKKIKKMLKAWQKSVISAVFGTWQDQPRCGCGRAERSRWQDPHVRTPARRTSWAAVLESSPSTRWKMSVARNGICWRRLTELFPSDTPGCGTCHAANAAYCYRCSVVCLRHDRELDKNGWRDGSTHCKSTFQRHISSC